LNRVGFRLLLITDGFDSDTTRRVAAALDALPAGLAAIQLRAKALSGRALLDAARALAEVTRPRGAPLVINDRGDVALAAADGVHLPSSGLPSGSARKVAGTQLVGASTHSIEEARMQARGGADYLTFGPVFATPSKADFGAPQGLDRLAEVCAAVEVPVFAVGGIAAENAREVVARGARVACIRAILYASDPAEAARKLASAVVS
jgi:thiamine-phosphate pyrophosphorylase